MSLPPIPDCWNTIDGEWCGQNTTYEVFTTAQLRAYGQQCYEAGAAEERERCAKLRIATPRNAFQCAARGCEGCSVCRDS